MDENKKRDAHSLTKTTQFLTRFLYGVITSVIPFILSLPVNSVFAQIPFSYESINDGSFQYGSPIYSETPTFPSPTYENGNIGLMPESYENVFNNSLPVFQDPQYTTSLQPQEPSTITGVDGSNYTILGNVTGPFNFGDPRFDNIPFLNEGFQANQRKLPELKVPQNTSEFTERVDKLLARFSQPKLSITKSTPSRLLRYSLIAGADETFLAPPNLSSPNENPSDASSFKPMYALGALCWNVPCANRRLMRVVNDRPVPEVGYGFQAQRGEFLATLAFAKIDRNYELRVDGKSFTVQDLIEWEKYSCSKYANLTLVAIGLAHYSQNPDEVWLNQFGEEWSLQKLLEIESLRPVDWSAADSTDKLLAFTYLLARLKQSARANSPELAPTLQRTESFLLAIKKRVWDIYGDSPLSDSLFFNSDIKLTTPYMKLYVNGRLLRWLTLVSSEDELNAEKMKRANAELCALVDQLFNSLEDLSQASEIDEESFSIALQTLSTFRKQIK